MDITCTVCLDSFLHEDEDPEVYMIPCGHLFHETCLEEWFKKNSSCPQCRLPALRDCMLKVYWERTPVSETSARHTAKAIRENKLLKLEVKALQKEIKAVRAEMRETRDACADMVAGRDGKVAAWQEVCGTYFKRINVLKLKVSALRASLAQAEDTARAFELKWKKARKLLLTRQCEKIELKARAEEFEKKLASSSKKAKARKDEDQGQEDFTTAKRRWVVMKSGKGTVDSSVEEVRGLKHVSRREKKDKFRTMLHSTFVKSPEI